MANCPYLKTNSGATMTCPETSPSDARCAICLALLSLDKGLHIPKPQPITTKLPS